MAKQSFLFDKKSFVYRFLKKVESPEEKPFFELMNRFFNLGLALYGKTIYLALRKKYPGYTFIINPACSSGDMIFLKLTLEKLKKMSGIEKYIMILDNGRVFNAACELDYENLYPVPRTTLKALFVYYRFNIDSVSDMINCYSWMMFDYKSSNCFFDSGELINGGGEYEIKLFEEKRLIPGKTIILSPYEQSISEQKLPKLKPVFWEKLAERLKAEGFCVCTNCSGSENEPVIRGTEAVFPKFSHAAQTTAYAGGIVALRSGIVDYISRAEAVKVILYPTRDYYNIWNTKRTCNDSRCTEIVYNSDPSQYDELISQIEQCFCKNTEVGS